MPARLMPVIRLGLTAACALLCLAGCAALRRPSTDLELAAADRDLARALAHYSQALIIEAEKGLGAPEAFEHYLLAATLDPGEHRLHAKLATEYFRRDEPEKAIEELKKSCAANPGSVLARLALARGYQFSGDIVQALREYHRANKMAPELPTIYLTLAHLYFQNDNDAEALKVLARAYEKLDSPETVRAYCYSTALRFIQRKRPDKAIACLKFVAERSDGDQAQLNHLIGELYEGQKDFDQAKKHYGMASEGDPPLPQSFVKLAMLQLHDDPAEAIRTLIRGDRQVADNLLILLALAQFYTTQERFQEAVETFERVARIVDTEGRDTLTAGFYLQYGAVCDQAGLKEKAESVFEGCIETYPDAHAALNYLAYMWAENGIKLDKALDYVKRALEQEPANGAYLDTLGWIYYKQEDHANALAYIQQAREAIPDDPTITDHLGDVYEALGRRDRAIVQWKASFMLNPEDEKVAAKLSKAGIDVDVLRKEAEKQIKASEPSEKE